MADYICPYCHAVYREAHGHCAADGSMLIEVPQVNDLSGQVFRRKYRLDSALGQGGFGAVYQATHLVLGKTVAVKVLRSEFRQDSTMVARFFNEARVVTRLANPHTIQTFDLDQTEEGLLFMVMEFVAGRTLRSLALEEGKPSGRLAWERALAILMQVCDSLEEAHGQSVIHRDLKPDNIMVSDKGGERDFATVLDFGIAKVLEDANVGLTAAGSLIGSPAYMSPEQILGRPLDARSDLYSLGAVAYQVLSGTLPVNARQTAAILQEKILVPPTHMRKKLPELQVPDELDDLVVALLATDPQNRPRTALEVKERMARMLSLVPGYSSVANVVLAPAVVLPVSAQVSSGGAAGTVAYEGRNLAAASVVVPVPRAADETAALLTAKEPGSARADAAGREVAGPGGGKAASGPVILRTSVNPVVDESALLETLQAHQPGVAVVAPEKAGRFSKRQLGIGGAGVVLLGVSIAALVWALSGPGAGEAPVSDGSGGQSAPHEPGPSRGSPKNTAARPAEKATDEAKPSMAPAEVNLVPAAEVKAGASESKGAATVPTPAVPSTPVPNQAPAQGKPDGQAATPAAVPVVAPAKSPVGGTAVTPVSPSGTKPTNPTGTQPKPAPGNSTAPSKPAAPLPPLPIPGPETAPGGTDAGKNPTPAAPVVNPPENQNTAPATPGGPASPTATEQPAGTPGQATPAVVKKKPKQKWLDGDMDDMEREMRDELKKSMEMWQDPSDEGQ